LPCKNQNVSETVVINALRATLCFPFLYNNRFPVSFKAAHHGNTMNYIIQSDNEQQQQQQQQQQSDQQQVFTRAEVEQIVHEPENSRLQR
jgi:hypothetical protein